MNFEYYFKDIFESFPDYRKIVLLMFLIKNDNDLLTECPFLKDDIDRLNLEFKNKLKEQNEEYLDYIKNEEESIFEAYFSTMYEDVRHERSLITILSLTESNILKQSKFTDDEIEIIKNLALKKLQREREY